MKKRTGYLLRISIAILFVTVCSGYNGHKQTKFNYYPPKPAWKIGVALYSFNRFSFARALEKADSAGAKYVEGFFFHKMGREFNDSMMFAISKKQVVEMNEMMHKKGIKMNSMYVGGAKTVKDWKSFFDVAATCKMEYLVCEPAREDWDVIDSLAGIYKIKIAIHEHSRQKSRYWHPDSVLAAIKGHPNIGACADLGHWLRSGLDPVSCLKKLRGHIIGIHLKDLDEANNEKANDVLVGSGVINFNDVIKELKSQHFTGTVQVECEHDWDDNLKDVTEALRFFNNLSF